MLIQLDNQSFQIDEDDWELVKDQNFSIVTVNGIEYVRTYTPELGHIDLHRQLLGVSTEEVDHKNRDSLDNRRSNLRETTRSLNLANRGPMKRNTSGFKGVTRKRTKWQAVIQQDGKDHYLGCYVTPVEAAKAYDRKAVELFGEFALTNEMLGLYV